MNNEKFIEFRKNIGWIQAKLGKFLGVSDRQVRHIEHGKRGISPGVENMLKIAKLLRTKYPKIWQEICDELEV